MRSTASWICVLCLAYPLADPQAGAQTPPPITVKDQYGKQVTIGAPSSDWILLIYGDRVGSNFSNNWSSGLRALPHCRIVFAANLRAVPFFMKGTVEGKFQGKGPTGKEKGPVLLDWQGKIGDAFGFTPSIANVYVFDRLGAMRAKDAGKGEKADLERLTATVKSLLPQNE
jgi:hypothetical protein